MANDITQTDGFTKLMKTVGILRGHYSKLADMAEAEMIKARIRGDVATAKKYKKLLDQMAADHAAALQRIGEKLTTPEELRETRKALRVAADEAHDFVQALKRAKLTIEKLTKATNFLTKLMKQLTKILV